MAVVIGLARLEAPAQSKLEISRYRILPGRTSTAGQAVVPPLGFADGLRGRWRVVGARSCRGGGQRFRAARDRPCTPRCLSWTNRGQILVQASRPAGWRRRRRSGRWRCPCRSAAANFARSPGRTYCAVSRRLTSAATAGPSTAAVAWVAGWAIASPGSAGSGVRARSRQIRCTRSELLHGRGLQIVAE